MKGGGGAGQPINAAVFAMPMPITHVVVVVANLLVQIDSRKAV